jgi:Nucleotide modification associated domain 3
MKIVLSRKGFDSKFGGCESPIFPNDEMLSLPIPEDSGFANANICYGDLRSFVAGFPHIGAIVEQLTSGRHDAKSLAHLDPHLDGRMYYPSPDWRALFGQIAAAQGHLRNQDVREGDLFLFYGLYREVEVKGKRIKFRPDKRARHVIFGWMSIGEVVPIEEPAAAERWSQKHPWGKYHSHLHGGKVKNNALYVAASDSFNGLPGAGIFGTYAAERCLTAPERTCSVWLLPKWFDPGRCGKPLSYNNNASKWSKTTGGFLLQTKSPGQEYVFDTKFYPEAIGWARDMIAAAG